MHYSIYGAGKTWMASRLKLMRDKYNFNINSRWIDVQQVLSGFDDEHPPEIHQDGQYKRTIWDNGCLQDCQSCNYMVLLAHPKDEDKHSGSLVELGIVTGLGKPVFILGTCASFEPIGHSDRAWRSQSLVTWMPEINVMDDIELLAGFRAAYLKYHNNYSIQAQAANNNVLKFG